MLSAHIDNYYVIVEERYYSARLLCTIDGTKLAIVQPGVSLSSYFRDTGGVHKERVCTRASLDD